MAYRFRPPRWSPARRSVWLVLILAFSTTLWLQARTGQPLRALVPGGIVALELAGTPGAANKISTTLGDDGRRAALVNVALDYAFIAAYVALLVALSSRFGADGDRFARGVRTLAVAAAIVAGACDTAENAGLLAILLRRRFDFAPLTRAFAVAKFVLVTGAGLYALTAWAGWLVSWVPRGVTRRLEGWALRLASIRPSIVFGAIAAGLPLTAYSDNVPGANMFGNLFVEYGLLDAFSFGLALVVTCWSIVITALLTIAVERRAASKSPAFRIWWSPVAWMCVLCGPGFWIVIAHARAPWRALSALVMAAAIVTTALMLLVLAIVPDAMPAWIRALGRRRPLGPALDRTGRWIRDRVSTAARAIQTFWLPLEYFADAKNLLAEHVLGFASLTIVTAGYIGLYAWFKYHDPHNLPPATFIFALLIPLVWLVSFFWLPLRRYRLTLFVVALGLYILYSLGGGPLRILGDPANTFDVVEEAAQRLEPDALIDGFAGGAADNHLIVVAASGGGILASGWTAKVLAELHRAAPRFGDELRLISSVSGGSVATAYYLAAHHAPLDQRALQQVLAASMRSSLSPAAYGLAFADLRRGLFPIWVDESFDRGRLLEADWRARGQRLYHGLDIDVGSPHDADLQPLTAWIENIRGRRAPGVIFNSTVMESGQRVAITPLSTLHAEWRSGSGLGGEPPERFQSPPTLGEFLAGGDQLTVDLWTAARVSATFAYVSPPARAARAYRDGNLIANRCRWNSPGDVHACFAPSPPVVVSDAAQIHGRQHLIDGGYADHSGVASALNWLSAALQRRTPGDALPFAKIALVEIRARPYAAPGASGELASTWSGPALGLLNAWNLGQTGADDTEIFEMKQRFAGLSGLEFQSFAFVLDKPNGPLSWQISEPQKKEVCAGWALAPNQQMLGQLLTFLGQPNGAPDPSPNVTPYRCEGVGR